jgi:hypothetical protein
VERYAAMGPVIILLTTAIAHANGPAWIAELSDTDPSRESHVDITIPLGSHVAVGVYNTDAVAPQVPDGVDVTVRVIWYEHRTVFFGMDEEREASIPYYLPEPKDCTPTGSWVVELEPLYLGVFEIPIGCNKGTVTVSLTCIDLLPSDIGYGFYTDMSRYADWTKEREYNRDMVRHGMNTFTASAREMPGALGREIDGWQNRPLENLVWHIETAIECGLVDPRFPLLFSSLGGANLIPFTKEIPLHDWPEMVAYNVDEPTMLEDGDKELVAERASRYHAAGLRTGTSLEVEAARALGDPLDIWILHMDGMSEEIIQYANAMGKERWIYNCSLRGTNAALHRYWTGVYAWALRPRVCLTWTYMHFKESRIMPDGTWNMLRVYDKAAADSDGLPIPTVALEGMSDGIVDSRLLQELERRNMPDGNAYLDKLRGQVDFGFWPNGKGRKHSTYVWDIPDLTVPPVDMVAMRQDVLMLLGDR